MTKEIWEGVEGPRPKKEKVDLHALRDKVMALVEPAEQDCMRSYFDYFTGKTAKLGMPVGTVAIARSIFARLGIDDPNPGL